MPHSHKFSFSVAPQCSSESYLCLSFFCYSIVPLFWFQSSLHPVLSLSELLPYCARLFCVQLLISSFLPCRAQCSWQSRAFLLLTCFLVIGFNYRFPSRISWSFSCVLTLAADSDSDLWMCPKSSPHWAMISLYPFANNHRQQKGVQCLLACLCYSMQAYSSHCCLGKNLVQL